MYKQNIIRFKWGMRTISDSKPRVKHTAVVSHNKYSTVPSVVSTVPYKLIVIHLPICYCAFKRLYICWECEVRLSGSIGLLNSCSVNGHPRHYRSADLNSLVAKLPFCWQRLVRLVLLFVELSSIHLHLTACCCNIWGWKFLSKINEY